MHISKVELENIKSHIDSKFEFSRGTTAITGRNGAGKTTIIEAIAWTLFDVLDYKKEDFVRRGAKKGVVRVTFESSLDEREFVVYRDTMTGYNVTDPQIGKRIADKREEVTRFLWQHLGLEPGTDLRALFKEAVGVPQGTLTAIFHGTPLERKATFDRLLKVEEYRQAAEKLRDTAKYIENNISAVNVRIARAEGELTRVETAELEFKAASDQVELLTAEAGSLAATVREKSESVAKLDEQAERATELAKALDMARAALERARILCRQSESDFRQASEADRLIGEVRQKAERHTELLGRLKEFEHERRERDKLRDELNKVSTAAIKVSAELDRAREALEAAQKAHAEIEPLSGKVADQERLEKTADDLKSKIAASRAIESQIKSLDERLARLRDSYKKNQVKLSEAESHVETASRLNDLERRDAEIIGRLAALNAALERDEKFRIEIRDGLCPVLSEKCLNLKAGQTLEGFLTEQFAGLRGQIATLETERAHVATGVAEARSAQKRSGAIETLRSHVTELVGEGKCLSDEKQELEKQLFDVPGLVDELKIVENELTVLDDPRGRIRFYQQTAARETDLRREISKIESNIERLESDKNILEMQLESYTDLDAVMTESSRERDATAEAHRVFLANEALAASCGDRERLYDAARIAAAGLGEMLVKAESESSSASAMHDRERHVQERSALRDAENKHSHTEAMLEVIKARRDQLRAELDRYSALRESVNTETLERDRLTKISETTAFIRDTLREAAPRVARNYVHHVSVEACQMFREICGHADQTLSWSIDYGISLEEEGYERPFGNLSGGEQMAAALSVRLAILKQLSDIRLAFFDEPTTNMDTERRENLAQHISQIKNFDQLFVISHDDTFEGYVDHTLRID
ncbi:MAG TPA: SMC family ATPase [Pyrinomonadaceae bacterium]